MAVTVEEYTHITKITWTWTSSSGGAASEATTQSFTGSLERLVTVPAGGGSAPTDNYDIVVNDGDGVDALLGAGANRDTANTEQVGASSLGIVAGSTLTLVVSNAGDTKAGTVHLYLHV